MMRFIMTGPELQKAIRDLGSNQADFARHCRISAQTLSRMCQGHVPVAKWLDMLIAEWAGHPNPPPISTRIYVNRTRPLRER